MIDGLDKVLEKSGHPGLPELRGLLQELLGGRQANGCFIEEQILQPRDLRVFRLRFVVKDETRTLVVKRVKPEIARRNELVAKRWLPAIGLTDCGPPLLASIAEPSGICVWHIYHDLGQHELDCRHPDREGIGLAIEVIARMHTRFAGHHLLGEVRLHGGDFGIHFFDSNVRDAIYAVTACQPSAKQQDQLRDRLLTRLHKLRDELPQRAEALEEYGGPETLLHGDLWTINVFVVPTAHGLQVRLIDWEHVGVGPASYDLSTFLLRFSPPQRPWIFDAYKQQALLAGWHLPPAQELNLLFETAEYARFANRVIWPAIALLQDRASWGWDVLAEVDRWFEHLEPVLPREQHTPATCATPS